MICWSEWLLCGALGLKKTQKQTSLVICIHTKKSPSFCGISKRVKSVVITANIFKSNEGFSYCKSHTEQSGPVQSARHQ